MGQTGHRQGEEGGPGKSENTVVLQLPELETWGFCC